MENGIFHIQMMSTVLVAALGWVVAHRFTSRRDRQNAERQTRVDALSAAYSALVRAGIRGQMVERDSSGGLLPTARDVEDAVAAIHLYGSPQLSRLANAYAREIGSSQSGDATVLVNDLRQSIRDALGLPRLADTPVYVRIDVRDVGSNRPIRPSV